MYAVNKKYPIRFVAHRTGLTAHVIRSWEKRYGAVVPQRTETNRRLYSDDDVEKLQLLRQAVNAGHTIGQLASMSAGELRELVRSLEISPPSRVERPIQAEGPIPTPRSPGAHYQACLDAIGRFYPAALDNALGRAAVELNHRVLLEEVVLPAIREVGDRWASGKLKIYQEHAATSVFRTFLGNLLAFSEPNAEAPCLVVATPTGQQHELGALVAAVAAAYEGWQAIYLGASLPAEEIAGAAVASDSAMVCLSFVFPADDAKTVLEIRKLRRYLPETTRLIAGGKAALLYRDHLEPFQVEVIATLDDFIKALKASRPEFLPGKNSRRAAEKK
jgi:MerR family transcriptional regulator, light-induced transcriptional regulator